MGRLADELGIGTITLEDIVKELRDGKKGVGGVGSNGRMKYIVI